MNNFTSRVVSTFTLCLFMLSAYSMDAAESMECASLIQLQKPTIKGKIYISRYSQRSAWYGPHSYHQKITACIGISSKIQMPLMPVVVMVENGENEEIDWRCTAPHAIQKFEIQQYKQETGKQELTREDLKTIVYDRILNKKFVHSLPIACLCSL